MNDLTRTALDERELEKARLVRDAESLSDLEIADLQADGRLVLVNPDGQKVVIHPEDLASVAELALMGVAGEEAGVNGLSTD